MKARNKRRIVFMATMLASFVIYLCVSVSQLLPFFIFVVLAAALIEAASAVPLGFAGIKEILQKRE